MRPEKWAERNDGLVTNDIAAAGGLSRGQVTRRRASGRYVGIRRGVMVINGAPPTWRQQVRAVALACGPDFDIAHLTAVQLLGGAAQSDGQIHVSGELTRSVRLDGVVAHRTGTREPGDRTRRDGIPCTSPLRTVIDISGALSDEALGKVVDDFVRRKLLNLEDLRARVDRSRPAPGRSLRRLRAVLAERLPGYEPGDSELEARIARVIDRAGLPRPSQQHRVRIDGSRYRIDFAWPELRLYLEGNGFGFHSLASDLDKDARRQNALVLKGWTPIEITWRMSDETIERTIRDFFKLVATRPIA